LIQRGEERWSIAQEGRGVHAHGQAAALLAKEFEGAPSGPMIAPPAEALARLTDLVERGRVQELQQALVDLGVEDGRLGPWVEEARALAEGFRLRELRALLSAPDEATTTTSE
jgi:hypothetical protein